MFQDLLKNKIFEKILLNKVMKEKELDEYWKIITDNVESRHDYSRFCSILLVEPI